LLQIIKDALASSSIKADVALVQRLRDVPSSSIPFIYLFVLINFLFLYFLMLDFKMAFASNMQNGGSKPSDPRQSWDDTNWSDSKIHA
jgi:hypothetical protein